MAGKLKLKNLVLMDYACTKAVNSLKAVQWKDGKPLKSIQKDLGLEGEDDIFNAIVAKLKSDYDCEEV